MFVCCACVSVHLNRFGWHQFVLHVCTPHRLPVSYYGQSVTTRHTCWEIRIHPRISHPTPSYSPICYFGSPIGRDRTYNDGASNKVFNGDSSFTEIFQFFQNSNGPDNVAIFDYLRTTTPPNFNFTTDQGYRYQRYLNRSGYENQLMDSVRTCNSFFFPQQFITESDVARLFEGMASSRVEREDFIITPDLRGQVPLHPPACTMDMAHTHAHAHTHKHTRVLPYGTGGSKL